MKIVKTSKLIWVYCHGNQLYATVEHAYNLILKGISIVDNVIIYRNWIETGLSKEMTSTY